MEEHNGKIPQNARININYKGKKPKVSFKYPVDKKNSETIGSMWNYVMMIWVVILIPGYLIIGLSGGFQEYEDTKLPFNSSTDYNISNADEFLEYYLQKERIEYYQEYYQESSIKIVLKKLMNAEMLYLLVMIFGWIPIYFPFKKKWDSRYHDFQAWTSRKKYRRFSKKDIQEKDGRVFVELPIFSNVICDFEATKDFSKYLEEFDITEYKFKYYRKKKCKKTKKKKRFNNETIFYARWYFETKPKNGYIEVIFK